LIFGDNNRARWYEDKKGEGSESSRLASTKKCEGCVEVSGVGKLL